MKGPRGDHNNRGSTYSKLFFKYEMTCMKKRKKHSIIHNSRFHTKSKMKKVDTCFRKCLKNTLFRMIFELKQILLFLSSHCAW